MRYLVSNIQWAAAMLSPNAQARLPRVMIVDATCADEVFKRAEDSYEGATILSAESEPMGKPSMDDLPRLREATKARIAQGVEAMRKGGLWGRREGETTQEYLARTSELIYVSPPCEPFKRRVREDSPEYAANRFPGVPRGRHLSTLLYESDWRGLADFTQEGGNSTNTIRVYAKNGRIIVVEEFGPEGTDGVELFYPSGQQKITDLVAEANAYANDATISIPTNRVREDSPSYVLAKSRERSKWPNFVVGTNRIDVEHRIYRFRGDGSYVLSLATTDGERVKRESAQMRVRHIVVSVVVEEKIVATNCIVPAAKRVSEGRPVYRVPRRRLHIEDEQGLTFCGEIIQYLPEGNVTDDVAGTLAHEPKGTCGRCIHYALIRTSRNAGRAA